MPSFASDKDDIAKLMHDLPVAAINGAAVDQFFTPNIRLHQKKDIDKLQATGFIKYEFIDYSFKELTFIDPEHAELPVTVAWATRNQEASTTATLKFEKIQGVWYFATADFWELTFFLWIMVVALAFVFAYLVGVAVQYFHIFRHHWINPNGLSRWCILALLPFSLPVYLFKKPWLSPSGVPQSIA